MSYTTRFLGRFGLSRRLAEGEYEYLKAFAATARITRDEGRASALHDSRREAVGLPIGPDGAYFVGGASIQDWTSDESVVNARMPPRGQPNLICQWVPSEDRCGIEWDHGPAFYEFVEWLEYLIAHFFAPWGINVNGTMRMLGEGGAEGNLYVVNNKVSYD
jgi:hypothetical protein